MMEHDTEITLLGQIGLVNSHVLMADVGKSALVA
jgi:hypothetical protein